MKRTFASLFGRIRTIGPVAAGLLLVLATGLVHGLWSNRWGDNADLETAAARLHDIPLDIEGWSGSEQKIDPERLAQAEAAGCLARSYAGDTDEKRLSVVLLCGRFGPLAVHTPEVCYGGAGYEMLGSPARSVVPLDDGSSAEVWTARFHKPADPSASPLRVVWAWSAGKGWLAPRSPRWTFRREPVLFKFYLAREMPRMDDPAEGDPCFTFLRAWLPRVDEALFGTPERKQIAQ